MELSEYKNIFEHEGEHFFYVSTHELVLSLLDRELGVSQVKQSKHLKILDAGCGTGLLSKKLQRFGRVIGIDFSREALKFAKNRGIVTKQARIEKIPFADNSFDVVVSIDVLVSKSIKNDLKPIKEFYRVLKPGGILILRVSANSWLKLSHDRHVHIGRRYQKGQFATKLKNAGFEISKLSYIHAPLFPLIVLRHFWEMLTKPTTHSTIGSVNSKLNSFIIWILRFENKVFHKINLPFGVGLITVCRKP